MAAATAPSAPSIPAATPYFAASAVVGTTAAGAEAQRETVMPNAPHRAPGVDDASRAGDTPRDQLLVGMNMSNVLTLDPAAATGNDVVPIAANLYDAVVTLNPADITQIQPGLAQQWTVAADRRRIDFTLRPDVRFASGNPVRADDVVWSLQRTVLLNRALASPWKSYGFTAKNVAQLMRVDGPLQFHIALPPNVDPKMVLYTLGTSIGAMVLDTQVVLAHAVHDDLGAGWLSTHAAGSGPFTLATWRPEDVLLLVRNPGYWAGPTALQRVVFRHIPESQSLRMMIDRGDLDLAIGMAAPDIAAMRLRDTVRVQSVSTGSLYYVALSMKDPHFKDARVREAVRDLIDYAGINAAVMPNYGIAHQRPVQAGLPGSLPDPGYTLNVVRAKRLLAEAGFPAGFETRIRVLADPPFLNIATSLQSTLAQAGIRAEVLTGTGNQVYGAMRERRFEMVVGRGGGGLEPDPFSNLRALVYNPNNADSARLTNFQGWRTGFFDAAINTMVDRSQQTDDNAEQVRLYRQIQQRYADAVGPIFPVSQATNTVVVSNRVRGYRLSPVWTTRLWAVSKTMSGVAQTSALRTGTIAGKSVPTSAAPLLAAQP
jgi:peptide/nickel transport system substrate-binding protein